MTRSRPGWVFSLCSALGLGCGAVVDVIDHSGGGGGDDPGDELGDSSEGATDGTDRQGNFPEPAMTVCGVLPDGVAPIGGLASAHAVQGVRAPGSTELPVASERVRLRIASFALAPGEVSRTETSPDPECGPVGWMVGFDLPEPLLPGTYPITMMPQAYGEFYEGYSINPEIGCGFGLTFTTEAQLGSGGELVIHAVTDHCVMGELRAPQLANAPEASLAGGFVAERSVVPCIPIGTIECE